jgi:hypothetical protein
VAGEDDWPAAGASLCVGEEAKEGEKVTVELRAALV